MERVSVREREISFLPKRNWVSLLSYALYIFYKYQYLMSLVVVVGNNVSDYY